MKIFVFISILALMGTQSVYGKDTEAGGAESQKSLVQNINTSDYSLKANESLKKPIKKWRYITGGVLATSAPIFLLASVVAGAHSFGQAQIGGSKYASIFLERLAYSFLFATIPGSSGIPRAVQGRYWSMGLVFTAIQGASILYTTYAAVKEFPSLRLSLTTLSLFLASAIWQAADAWILSDSYELAEKSNWGLTPTYSYNKDTGSNAYGLALQYLY